MIFLHWFTVQDWLPGSDFDKLSIPIYSPFLGLFLIWGLCQILRENCSWASLQSIGQMEYAEWFLPPVPNKSADGVMCTSSLVDKVSSVMEEGASQLIANVKESRHTTILAPERPFTTLGIDA